MKRNILYGIAIFLIFDFVMLVALSIRDTDQIRRLFGIEVHQRLVTDPKDEPSPNKKKKSWGWSPKKETPTQVAQSTIEQIDSALQVPISLTLLSEERLPSGQGTKSVLLSADQKYIYAINLEAMSVEEINRSTRLKTRTLLFDKTPATGFDYATQQEIPNSYAEKPVEGRLTHQDRYLWISLHNAHGVAVWDLKGDNQLADSIPKSTGRIKIGKNSQPVRLRFFPTGKTPKYMVTSQDGKYLFVTNWHSQTISVLDISSQDPNDWQKIKDMPAGRKPRGAAVSEDNKWLFVANMGGTTITKYSIDSLLKQKDLYVGSTPRHILLDSNLLYISLTQAQKIVKYDWQAEKFIAEATTEIQPRTLAFSHHKSLLFDVCYDSDRIQVFTADSLKLLGSWESTQSPIGIVVHQQGDTLEAWACNHKNLSMKVFTFKMNFASAPLANDSVSLSEAELESL